MLKRWLTPLYLQNAAVLALAILIFGATIAGRLTGRSALILCLLSGLGVLSIIAGWLIARLRAQRRS